MSNGTFVLVLAAGAALLAMWTHVRFPSLAPERIGRERHGTEDRQCFSPRNFLERFEPPKSGTAVE